MAYKTNKIESFSVELIWETMRATLGFIALAIFIELISYFGLSSIMPRHELHLFMLFIGGIALYWGVISLIEVNKFNKLNKYGEKLEAEIIRMPNEEDDETDAVLKIKYPNFESCVKIPFVMLDSRDKIGSKIQVKVFKRKYLMVAYS